MNGMYSCKKVAELLSQRFDEPFGLVDRLRLRVHLSMCNNCRHVENQLTAIHLLIADLFSSGQASGNAPEDDNDPAGKPRGSETQ